MKESKFQFIFNTDLLCEFFSSLILFCCAIYRLAEVVGVSSHCSKNKNHLDIVDCIVMKIFHRTLVLVGKCTFFFFFFFSFFCLLSLFLLMSVEV